MYLPVSFSPFVRSLSVFVRLVLCQDTAILYECGSSGSGQRAADACARACTPHLTPFPLEKDAVDARAALAPSFWSTRLRRGRFPAATLERARELTERPWPVLSKDASAAVFRRVFPGPRAQYKRAVRPATALQPPSSRVRLLLEPNVSHKDRAQARAQRRGRTGIWVPSSTSTNPSSEWVALPHTLMYESLDGGPISDEPASRSGGLWTCR